MAPLKPKQCRKRTDKLLSDAVNDKRNIMRETLDALSEEVKKIKAPKTQLAK